MDINDNYLAPSFSGLNLELKERPPWLPSTKVNPGVQVVVNTKSETCRSFLRFMSYLVRGSALIVQPELHLSCIVIVFLSRIRDCRLSTDKRLQIK